VVYKLGDSVSLADKDAIIYNVTSPYLASGLANDLQYAFSVMASNGNSPVGPLSTALTATPRLLGPAVAWFEGTSLTVNNLNNIAFGANTYVAVGDAASLFVGTYSYTEDLGVAAWDPPTTITVTAGTDLTAVIFDGFRFVALGSDGAVIRNADTDFLTWEAATAITAAPAMNSLAVGAGVYVAVGDGGAIYTNTSVVGTDAWVLQTSGTTENLNSVAFVNDRYIAVGDNGVLLSSIDGISWDSQVSNSANALRAVAFGVDNYVVVGDAGTIISSSDAIAWTVQSIPTTESLRSIVFGVDGQFIAVGTAGVLAYSATGADGSWAISNAGVIDLNSLASNFVFIAVGDAGANVSGK
jgi:hypothetical protein